MFLSLRIIMYLWLPISTWAVTGEYRCSTVKAWAADSWLSEHLFPFQCLAWVPAHVRLILTNTLSIPPSTCYRNLGVIKITVDSLGICILLQFCCFWKCIYSSYYLVSLLRNTRGLKIKLWRLFLEQRVMSIKESKNIFTSWKKIILMFLPPSHYFNSKSIL